MLCIIFIFIVSLFYVCVCVCVCMYVSIFYVYVISVSRFPYIGFLSSLRQAVYVYVCVGGRVSGLGRACL